MHYNSVEPRPVFFNENPRLVIISLAIKSRNTELDLFNYKNKEEGNLKLKKENTEINKFIKNRNWLHTRNKIKHSIANLRLCQKPPPKSKDGTKVVDEMQELRINQYGKYIQEKLGLFKKPTKLDLMLFSYSKINIKSTPPKSIIHQTPEVVI